MAAFIPLFPLFPRTHPSPVREPGAGDGNSFAAARLALGWHMLNDFGAPLPAFGPRGLR